MVRPMEILKNKDQRLVLSNPFQRFAQLAHHASACRSENLSFESGVLVRSDERGHLNYPRWRMHSQGVDDIASRFAPRKLSQRFEDRVISFLAAETLYRLTPNYPGVWSVPRSELKCIDEAGLSNSRLTGNKHNLTAPMKGVPKILFQ